MAVTARGREGVDAAFAALVGLGLQPAWAPGSVMSGVYAAGVHCGSLLLEVASSEALDGADKALRRPAQSRVLAVSVGAPQPASADEALASRIFRDMPSTWAASLVPMLARRAQARFDYAHVEVGEFGSSAAAVPPPSFALGRVPGVTVSEVALGQPPARIRPLLAELGDHTDTVVPGVLAFPSGPRLRLHPSPHSALVLRVADLAEAQAALRDQGVLADTVGASGASKGQQQLRVGGLPGLDVRLCDADRVATFFCERRDATAEGVLDELQGHKETAMSCSGVQMTEFAVAAKAMLTGKAKVL